MHSQQHLPLDETITLGGALDVVLHSSRLGVQKGIWVHCVLQRMAYGRGIVPPSFLQIIRVLRFMGQR